MMQIYWIEAQAPLRVLSLVKYLGLEAETTFVKLDGGGLKSEAYSHLNPNQKAPTLVDGDFVLWESLAIMAHLCIKAGSDLWPGHRPEEQVQILKWIGWNGQHWEPPVSAFYFEHVVKSLYKIGEPDRAALEKRVPDLLRWAKVLNSHLAAHPFLACDRLTIADFQLASMARYWKEAEMPLQEFPHIIRWLDELMKMPAWAQPWPE